MLRLRHPIGFVLALFIAIAVILSVPGATSAQSDFGKQRITFKSGNITLVGYLFKPEGDGSFPGLIWNHGSEQDPDKGQQFDGIAKMFVPAGYVVFAPMRRGHGDSEGQYIGDQIDAVKKAQGQEAAQKLQVELLSGPQLDDQLAGLDYLKTLPYVDTKRLGDIGCSYGGIQTIFGAEKGAGYKAAVALSPGAESWENKYLQARMIKAVSGINMPVLLIHPAHDVSQAPGYALGQEFLRLKKPYGLLIFPPIGTEQQQGHCFGGLENNSGTIWGPSAIQFFNNTLQPGK